MLKHITENDYNIRPGCAVRTLQVDIEPLVDLQAKYEIEIQASAFLGTANPSVCRGMDDGRTDENNGKCGYICRQSLIPVMFVTEDTTRSNPDDIKMVIKEQWN